MIDKFEIETGQKSTMNRTMVENQIMEQKDVREAMEARKAPQFITSHFINIVNRSQGHPYCLSRYLGRIN
jgi:hypothetical protein